MKIIKIYYEFLIESKLSSKIPIPNDIIEISNAYIKAGKDIFLVGGAVRDHIKGIKPKDYDLVTNALPEESKKILKGFNVSDEQGKNFGVLRVYTKDRPEGYEIASFRRDISGGRDTKGNDQKVEMGHDVTIEDDCMRRDLTMNALYYDIKNKKIVDLVGGINDIKNGIVRTVGDANRRFIEDRLRICRIFRFAAVTGGRIDNKTSEAIKKDNRLRGIGPKDDVSQERIFEEFKKAFEQSKDYTKYLNFYTDYNMWSEVFPGVKINTKIKKSNYLEIYFANLFKLEGIINPTKLMYTMVQKFKMDIDFSRKVIFLIDLLNLKPENVIELYKKKVVSRVTDEMINEWLKIEEIDDPMFDKFLEYKPSISAEELMKRGFKGKDLGEEIKRLEIKKFKSMIK
jgi:tRNA nucleotidyltransferase/poly(A) polymerase